MLGVRQPQVARLTDSQLPLYYKGNEPSALYVAAQKKRLKVIKLLIEADADPVKVRQILFNLSVRVLYYYVWNPIMNVVCSFREGLDIVLCQL